MADKNQMCDVAEDNFVISEATSEQAGSIQAIDKGSVHRICSGQVVLTLAIAVKELVENSVDAKATTVEVKLKEHGSEVIEVSDNGSGVEEKNFAGLTLKHHTSKIQDFSDVVGVETFGFRGEALSSLCALSNLSVVTCHEGASVGTKLEFDHHGKITSQTPCPRQRGTTVYLQNLFSTLPVRHREFHRNLKKEYAKMVQVLNAYCLVTTGVRISCTNQVGKGSRSTVISTKGNTTLRENIANIFGPKCLQSLLEFKQHDPTEEVCSWFNVKPHAQTEQLFRIEGYVSKCEHGQGRSSSDRQFIFINKRPCDSSKLTKLVNEVYHSYNRHQYPFLVLTINMDKDSVDVNVTPDKRQIFLQGEKLLLATLKTSLVKMFEPTTSVLKINSFLTFNNRTSRDDDSSDTGSETSLQLVPEVGKQAKPTLGSTLSKLKRSFSSAFSKDDGTGNPQSSSPQSKQMKLETSWTLSKSQSLPSKFNPENSPSLKFLSNHSIKTEDSKHSDCAVPGTTPVPSPSLSQTQTPVSDKLDDTIQLTSDRDLSMSETPDDLSQTPSPKLKTVTSFMSPANLQRGSKVDSFLSSFKHTLSKHTKEVEDSSKLSDGVTVTLSSQSGVSSLSCSQDSQSSDVFIVPDIGLEHVERDVDVNVTEPSMERLNETERMSSVEDDCVRLSGVGYSSQQDDCVKSKLKALEEEGGDVEDVASHWVDTRTDAGGSGEKAEDRLSGHGTVLEYELFLEITYDPLVLREFHEMGPRRDEKEEIKKRERKVPFSFSVFKAKQEARNARNREVSDNGKFSRSFRAKIAPGDNQSAEEELQREVKKDMFAKMEIIGQFNLGFILAKLGEDLFIVDQHATDEKYNFEMLQRHTVIQSQKLIHPQNLELTASNETILIDNIEIFKKNGFDFIIDETAPPTQRVKLSSTPVSKNWNFGKDDIEELIFMLTDSPGIMCRPSRVRMMFASRACRKAIMIGTALNKGEMKKLLCHMGEIEQPWNCPHGRPTMRHLFNLNMLPK